ncbi:MAG: type III-B CRISPR-associated protein Cas10/Cmr2 [Thainema sp.]
MSDFPDNIKIAIAQCLTWQSDLTNDQVIQALNAVDDTLQNPFAKLTTRAELEKFVTEKTDPILSKNKIGLVYGGATKIKNYVFESADLQEIRGASALLDRINLIDLPAFFKAETDGKRFPQCEQAKGYCKQVRTQWLGHQDNFPKLVDTLTPEMVIYSTGGNILAFCPEELVDDLADAIEKRYTTETLTANACAVGAKFSPLEIYLGLLGESLENTLWLDTVEAHKDNPAVRAYLGLSKKRDKNGNEQEVLRPKEAFKQRKGFSELVGQLANQFNQRRSGYDALDSHRSSRCYPPMFETHPYLMRDDSDRRSAVLQVPADQLTKTPKFSEPLARKYLVGQISKREYSSSRWYFTRSSPFRQRIQGRNRLWKPGPLISWVSKFEQFVDENGFVSLYDDHHHIFYPRRTRQRLVQDVYRREARTLAEIGAADPNGFVAYVYADGNNMGQYIRDSIKTPEHYQQFSQDVFDATEKSVYWAIAHHVHPYEYTPDAKSPRRNRNPVWSHPFEIITIGGDDVLIIVPANKALEIAASIGQEFEQRLSEGDKPYMAPNTYDPTRTHRNSRQISFCPIQQNRLSMSSGVLITSADTPIYYAFNLVSQLLKSAKKKAKTLSKREDNQYLGGTVDFLTLKAVTMISSNIESFRNEGLTVRFPERQQELKLYGAPYTLHELDGLISTVRAVKASGFPRSQLYQIRTLLEQGKRTAILNYRYFRVRLKRDKDPQKDPQQLLIDYFENAWCKAKTNDGNLAPWMTLDDSKDNASVEVAKEKKTIYETLWRELVDLYPFIEAPVTEVPKDIDDAQEGKTQSASSEEA